MKLLAKTKGELDLKVKTGKQYFILKSTINSILEITIKLVQDPHLIN